MSMEPEASIEYSNQDQVVGNSPTNLKNVFAIIELPVLGTDLASSKGFSNRQRVPMHHRVTRVKLEQGKNNRIDPNAIYIMLSTAQRSRNDATVGYLPWQCTSVISPLLDDVKAFSINKTQTQEWIPYKTEFANLKHPDVFDIQVHMYSDQVLRDDGTTTRVTLLLSGHPEDDSVIQHLKGVLYQQKEVWRAKRDEPPPTMAYRIEPRPQTAVSRGDYYRDSRPETRDGRPETRGRYNPTNVGQAEYQGRHPPRPPRDRSEPYPRHSTYRRGNPTHTNENESQRLRVGNDIISNRVNSQSEFLQGEVNPENWVVYAHN